jgi:hypothetical protein
VQIEWLRKLFGVFFGITSKARGCVVDELAICIGVLGGHKQPAIHFFDTRSH